jgi:hypothetical protein
VNAPPARAPRICALVPSLGGDDEVTWVQDLVVSALAGSAEVHVLFVGPVEASAFADHNVTVHPLGPGPDTRAVLRRDLLVANFSVPTVGYEFPRRAQEKPVEVVDLLLPHDTASSWELAAKLLESIDPDLVVVCDHRDTDVMKALESIPGTPVFLIPFADTAAASARVHYDRLFERVDGMIVFSEAEWDIMRARSNRPIMRVEIPVDLEPLFTPEVAGQDDPFILILVDAGDRDRFGLWPYADLVGLANPTIDVVVVSHDSTVCWRGGHRLVRQPIVTAEDLRHHVVRASVVVDLHPGRLVARRCIEALRLGTPVVVPAGSRARGICEHSEGGLAFRNAGELLSAVETVLDPQRGPGMGERGRAYADEHHGSPARFAEQLFSALGLPGGNATRLS